MIELLARLGYASKAFVYAIVGLLGGAAALRKGGRVTDTRGALGEILSQPLGNTVLLVLATGLCGYAAWRVLDALLDPERRGTTPKGLVARIGNVVRGLIYGGLGLDAFRLARGLRSSGGGDANVRMWTARVMDLPFGDWLVAGAGTIVAVYGLSEITNAIKHKGERSMDLSPLPSRRKRVLMRVSRFGVAARALIIVALGAFLVRAAIQHDPSQAHGARESVLELAGNGGGVWALGVIALGLLAYAVDQALHAKFRRIRSPV